MLNGDDPPHTGEVFALTAEQRTEATIVADEVKGRLPAVSGICCEGVSEAVEQAQMAREVGASALLVMPPHQWLRFGMKQPDNVVDYFSAIGTGSELDIVVRVYPAWTRASYDLHTLAALSELPWVKCMSAWPPIASGLPHRPAYRIAGSRWWADARSPACRLATVQGGLSGTVTAPDFKVSLEIRVTAAYRSAKQ